MGEQISAWLLDPHNQLLFLSVLIAFIIGLIVGRLILSKKRQGVDPPSQKGDRAFLKGIQYLLSDDHDQAIEEFSKSVQMNSDTVETYVALGNLYRSRGDIDRAIRIRQSIILRPNLDDQIKVGALYDLGLDYRKGGFLNRALETFLEVLKKQPSHIGTLKEIEKIYEEMKDWENAYASRQKIARQVKGFDHAHILAHHQTEMGKAYEDQGEPAKARSCYRKAVSIDDHCIDAYLHLGDLFFVRGEYKKAIATWKEVVRVAPHFTFLAYRRLEGAYSTMKNLKPVEEFLKDCAESNADAFTHLALARYLYNEQDDEGALREIHKALKLDPCFWEARKYLGEILLDRNRKEEALQAYNDLISHLDVPYMRFRCTFCGFIPIDLLWQCPQCRQWDTINVIDSGGIDSRSQKQLPQSISELPVQGTEDEI
ncbi:tetratricopeptide repeat protein [Thermodesulfobacteriota bacterium]